MSRKRSTIAVGYARRSTDMQERSIPDQKAFVERWAKDNGYRIDRWYVDDAISGTSAKGRAAFERMMKDAEGGGTFTAVLCYDMSRFSRGGTNETGFYLHRLQVAGVDAIFCAEGIPEGEEGELLQGVKSWQARQYSVKLSRDCIRGTISHIMQKKCAPGGKPPYGYDKQHCTAAGQVLRTFRWLPDGRKQEFGGDGKLIRVLEPGESVKKAKSDIVRYVPGDPDRVKVVRRIFDRCIEGYGYHHIANRLNEEGIPGVDGGKWLSSTISRLLANPVYRGAIAWNRRTLGKLNGVAGDGTLRPKRGGAQRNNREDDWFVVEKAHEPLVTPAIFKRARRAVEGRRDQGGLAKPVNRSLLSGLIICRSCGHRFLQKKVNSTSGGERVQYRYYTDGGYNRGGKTVCRISNIPADALDVFVVGRLRDVLLGDHDGAAAAIDRFVDAVMSRHDDGGGADARAVKKDLVAVERRIKATIGMLADPAFDGLDELKVTLADLKKRRDGLQSRLDRGAREPDMPYTERDLRMWADDRFARFDDLDLSKGATPEARRLVHAYVDRIEIDPHERRGTLVLPADAFACLERDICTRGAHGYSSAEGNFNMAAFDNGTACSGAVECSSAPPTGRCCLASGCCEGWTERDCRDSGGVYGGNDTNCRGVAACPEPEVGACCLSDGSCQEQSGPNCDRAGGTFYRHPCCTTPCPCTGDLNGNGAVDFADVIELLSAWGPCSAACPADLDVDGQVGYADLLMFLGVWAPWFPGPCH